MTARPLFEARMRLVRDEQLSAADDIVRGQDAERNGRRAEARAHYEGALAKLSDGTATLDAATLLRRIAFTYQVDLDLDAAEDCAMAALAVAEAYGDEAGVGHANNVLAILEWRRGRLDEAERLYLAARTSARQAGDVRLAAMTAQNLGIMASIAGDLRGALRFYHSSLADYRALGLSTEMMRALNNLGMLYKELERWDAAQRSFTEAVEIGTLAGDLSTLISVHLNVATMWIARGEFDRAREAAGRADQIAITLDDHHADGERSRVTGVLAREARMYPDAEQAFRRAVEFAVEHSDLSLEADGVRELADLYRRQGRNREALQFLARAHRIFSQLRARRDVADIERRNAKLESEFLEVVQRWGDSIEAKDIYTQGHCERVSELACALASRAGIPRESMFWFRIGAVLHDVGKLVVPSEILNKPGPLSAAEWQVIRTHPNAGAALLSEVDFPGDVVPIVRSHHEQWNGAGYPEALAGEAIPLSARIVAIADVYDALTSERSYQMPYTHLEAMEIMRREVGRRFDPGLFETFEALMQEGGFVGRRRRTPATSAAPVAAITIADATDDLTGVLTRRAFIEVVTPSLEARTATSPASLLVLDIDLFKRVNDAFGHLRGDAVLQAIGEELRTQTEGRGVVGRFAGDEFVMWLPYADREEAATIAEEIRAAVQRRRIGGENGTPSLAVTVTIGVAAAPVAGRTFEELFAAADRAMYDAKRSGRNRVGSTAELNARPEPTLSADRFVGRGRELEQLTLMLDETMRRRPQLLLLSGDAGVGKTTLLRQLAADVRLRGGAFVSGQCFESDLRPPYSPWVDALTALAMHENVPTRAWTELPRLVPALGTPSGEAPPSKYALYEEVTEFLRLASGVQLLTIALEDMQWADGAAWDLLEHVQSRLTNERVLLCLTVRDDPMRVLDTDRRVRLSRDERLRPMPLAPLSSSELRIWLESVLDRRDLAPELLEVVQMRTEGNPLLVNQLLRAMIDEHALWHDGARWQWRLPLEVALPAGSYDLFARRIERLEPLSRRILSVAAVIGRHFHLDLLVSAGEWDEDDVLEAVDNGIEAGVIETIGDTDEPHLSFCHGLLHDVLRRGINPRRARRVHERVAVALERRNPRAAAELAEHYDRAGNASRAYEHALRAGDAAADVHAPEDAITFFHAAARHARTPAQKLRAFQSVIRVAERMGAYARCATYAARALEEVGGLVSAAERLSLNIQQARALFNTGAKPTETLRVCAELLDEAVRLDAGEERVAVAILQSLAFARCGDFAAAEQAAANAVMLAAEAGNEAGHVTALLRHGSMVLERSPDAALEIFRRAMTIAESLGDAHAEAKCRINVGVACARSQRDEAANTAYETAAALAARIRAPDLAGLAALNLGVLRLHTGSFNEAREQLASAVRLFTLVHNEAHRLAALYNAATVERECGNASAAADLYGKARDLAKTLGHRDVALGAAAGAGLAAIRLARNDVARLEAAALRGEIAGERDRWFQGREMVEALLVRDLVDAGRISDAAERFWNALAIAERHDQYGAAWFVAEVVTELVAAGRADAWRAAERFSAVVAKMGYASLSARYIVLQDLAHREIGA
jgi:diguanylate cyclase (GGDEF)-like protein/putative nucleotidyltransferase with HDIG domain